MLSDWCYGCGQCPTAAGLSCVAVTFHTVLFAICSGEHQAEIPRSLKHLLLMNEVQCRRKGEQELGQGEAYRLSLAAPLLISGSIYLFPGDHSQYWQTCCVSEVSAFGNLMTI